jgi:hypothetical protein
VISSLLIGLAQTTSFWYTEESGYRSEICWRACRAAQFMKLLDFCYSRLATYN